jgi:hypothetical protein
MVPSSRPIDNRRIVGVVGGSVFHRARNTSAARTPPKCIRRSVPRRREIWTCHTNNPLECWRQAFIANDLHFW